MDKVYYQNQTSWGMDDFYYLHRYLNKLVYNSAIRKDEIEELQLNRMSDITKVLLYVVIRFQAKMYLLSLPNLDELKETKPLPAKLNLVEQPTDAHGLYVEYNIGL